MLIPKYTENFRKQLLDESRNSTYFFGKGILGYPDLAKPFHYRLCENLDGRGEWGPDWFAALISAFRGSLKTSVFRAYCLRRVLFDYRSVRYIGSSFDNAKLHFLQPIDQLFRGSAQADRMLWLFHDRVPEKFDGWNENQIAFLQPDPTIAPSFSIKGIDSAQEGTHVHILGIDDPEGAEEEKTMTVKRSQALRAISAAVPLLTEPGRDKLVLIGTVHGPDPFVYRILYESMDPDTPAPAGEIEWDNSKRSIKVFWQPIHDEHGRPTWPQRFPEERIAKMRGITSARDFLQQYLLLPARGSGNWISSGAIDKAMASWKIPGKIISYPAMKIDETLWRRKQQLEITWERREVKLSDLLIYIHFDPKHREKTGKYQRTSVRPSKAAVVTTGVAADGHIFVLDRWSSAEVSIDEQLDQVVGFHTKYHGARVVTYDPIGAQNWIKSILQHREQNLTNYRYQGFMPDDPLGKRSVLPHVSSLLVEDKRSPRIDKETTIAARLEPLILRCQLHFFADQTDLISEVKGIPDGTVYVDLVDALAQGAGLHEGRIIWQAPAGGEAIKKRLQNERMMDAATLSMTGYRSPFAGRPQGETRIFPNERARVVGWK